METELLYTKASPKEIALQFEGFWKGYLEEWQGKMPLEEARFHLMSGFYSYLSDLATMEEGVWVFGKMCQACGKEGHLSINAILQKIYTDRFSRRRAARESELLSQLNKKEGREVIPSFSTSLPMFHHPFLNRTLIPGRPSYVDSGAIPPLGCRYAVRPKLFEVEGTLRWTQVGKQGLIFIEKPKSHLPPSAEAEKLANIVKETRIQKLSFFEKTRSSLLAACELALVRGFNEVFFAWNPRETPLAKVLKKFPKSILGVDATNPSHAVAKVNVQKILFKTHARNHLSLLQDTTSRILKCADFPAIWFGEEARTAGRSSWLIAEGKNGKYLSLSIDLLFSASEKGAFREIWFKFIEKMATENEVNEIYLSVYFGNEKLEALLTNRFGMELVWEPPTHTSKNLYRIPFPFREHK
jgi:hypothetical protein